MSFEREPINEVIDKSFRMFSYLLTVIKYGYRNIDFKYYLHEKIDKKEGINLRSFHYDDIAVIFKEDFVVITDREKNTLGCFNVHKVLNNEFEHFYWINLRKKFPKLDNQYKYLSYWDVIAFNLIFDNFIIEDIRKNEVELFECLEYYEVYREENSFEDIILK